MPDFSLPRALIVIQVIFGSPLRGKREFRSGDIEELTVADIGVGNYAKTLDKLVELGWLRVTARRETVTRGGRPSMYIYSRTDYGRQEYRNLARTLAKFGIQLQ
jgi:DNA-binding PadR family transcriptional regulator